MALSYADVAGCFEDAVYEVVAKNMIRAFQHQVSTAFAQQSKNISARRWTAADIYYHLVKDIFYFHILLYEDTLLGVRWCVSLEAPRIFTVTKDNIEKTVQELFAGALVSPPFVCLHR